MGYDRAVPASERDRISARIIVKPDLAARDEMNAHSVPVGGNSNAPGRMKFGPEKKAALKIQHLQDVAKQVHIPISRFIFPVVGGCLPGPGAIMVYLQQDIRDTSCRDTSITSVCIGDRRRSNPDTPL